MLMATSTSTFGDETISPVHPHFVAVVEGGGGTVQHVPFNIPGFGNDDPDDYYGFGALGALSEDDKNKLAQQLKEASTSFTGDPRSILAAIPTDTDRADVAAKAVALGGDASRINSALASVQSGIEFKKAFNIPMPLRIFWSVASILSSGAGVYHGYKRNNSIGWALWWGLMGGLFPIVTPAIALAQGFGQPKSRRGSFGRVAMKSYRRKAR
jgi:hypothetical protein